MTNETTQVEVSTEVASRSEFALLYAQIKERLAAATPGPWTAEKGGAQVYDPDLSKDEPFFSSAEDDCILGHDKSEILGCSEWMRVDWADLEFMANARRDIEVLVAEIERLKSI